MRYWAAVASVLTIVLLFHHDDRSRAPKQSSPEPSNGTARCILFAAHDPGAQNDIGPLHGAAKARGLVGAWVDLRASGVLLMGSAALHAEVHAQTMRLSPPCLCVLGFSTNFAELEVAEWCAGAGAKTLMVLQFLAGARLLGAPSMARNVHRLVGTTAAASDLQKAHGLAASHTHVTGSAYLEAFARRRLAPPPVSR